MTWLDKYKVAWNAGIERARDYEDNHHKSPDAPTLPGGNRTVYDGFEAGGNYRRPFTGGGEIPGTNVSLTDPDKADQVSPGQGNQEISPGVSILETYQDEKLPSGLTDHYHEDNRFVSDDEKPKMTDGHMPKTIGTQLQSRVPIKLR